MRDHKPTLLDIAQGLSVIQRWNGMTLIPWDVLRHSLLVSMLLPDSASTYVRLYALLHDAAEMYTGDIPRPYKVPEQRDLERGITAEIFAGLWLNLPTVGEKAAVRYVDELAGAAESQVLVPLAKRNNVKWPDGATSDEVEAITKTIWDMRDMSQQESISMWVDWVSILIDEYLMEKP